MNIFQCCTLEMQSELLLLIMIDDSPTHRVEDHDDLTPVFNQCTGKLDQQYGKAYPNYHMMIRHTLTIMMLL